MAVDDQLGQSPRCRGLPCGGGVTADPLSCRGQAARSGRSRLSGTAAPPESPFDDIAGRTAYRLVSDLTLRLIVRRRTDWRSGCRSC